MRMLKLLCQWPIVAHKRPMLYSDGFGIMKCGGYKMEFSTRSDDSDLKDFAVYMDSLKNYEKLGVPKRAGTDSEDGFDLGRMRRLMELLGNPQSKFKAVHIAGTKGKGSTAAFLSNILRAEGYSVGSYTSPHIQTIRERMSIGRLGEPVSGKALNSLFLSIKEVIDQAMELEDGCITHFEVLTAMAFALFAKQNVDIAVIEAGLGGARDATNIISSSELATSIITTIGEEHLAALGGSLESIALAKSGIIKHGCPLVLGGPFLPHIERILLDKASSMSSPVVLASDAKNRIEVKGISMVDDIPCQCCDIVIHVEREPNLSIELFNVKLRMLGSHMVQNAATATCAALCLRNLGWKLSDSSIRAGLETTYLLGRSQVLSPGEAEALGLPKTTIMLDGAHTKESAKALVETIKMSFPEARLALVVAMASDKDHSGFAREFFSGVQLDAVCFTEAVIAGSKTRTTPAPVLRDCWVRVSEELGMPILHDGMTVYQKLNKGQSDCFEGIMDNKTILVAEESFFVSMKVANEILLRGKQLNESDLIVVTGSFHVVSLALAVRNG